MGVRQRAEFSHRDIYMKGFFSPCYIYMKIFAGYVFSAILDVRETVEDGWPRLWPEGACGPAFEQTMRIKFRPWFWAEVITCLRYWSCAPARPVPLAWLAVPGETEGLRALLAWPTVEGCLAKSRHPLQCLGEGRMTADKSKFLDSPLKTR